MVTKAVINIVTKNTIPLISTNPYYSFALVANAFYPMKDLIAGIHPKAHIGNNVKYDNSVQIAPGAVISSNVTLGKNCFIGANTVIIKEVPNHATMVGNPAKNINKDKNSFYLDK